MIRNESYYVINGWMINELKLKGVSLIVYAIIYGFCQDGETIFNGNRQYLADFTNSTKPTIDKALNELIEKKLIFKESNVINNIKFNYYKINFKQLENFTGGKETLLGGKETLYNDNTNNIIKDIINYLNITCNKNYKYNIDKTKKLIKARLNEGFTFEDFKKVIDNKAEQWKKDEMMNQYLRPETLFGNKFESYLNSDYKSKKIEEGELI